MVPESCSFTDCDKPGPSNRGGLCEGHKSQRRAGRELRPLRTKYTNPVDLIDAHVDKSGECWEWTALKDGKGYGKRRWQGVYWRAHRLSFTAHCGPIPDGLSIDHMCHNRGCVNPAHLRLATNKQNQENRGYARSASGYLGVLKEANGSTWRATVMHNGVRHSRRGFPTAEAADAAAREMRLELFTYNIKDQIKARAGA